MLVKKSQVNIALFNTLHYIINVNLKIFFLLIYSNKIMKLKKLLKLFIPEIVLIIKRKIFKHKLNSELFDGYNTLFKKSFSLKSIYGEYGCGKSTIYVLKSFNIPIYSVDSSEYWVNEIKKKYQKNNLNIKHINIGNVEPYSSGRPEDYSLRHNIMNYPLYIWQQELKPNVILIDGRFRVLCFLVSLKLCDENTIIIFDDYVDRKYYHIVEEFIKPISKDGRQSLFVVSNKSNIDMNKLEFLIDKFNYVMD